jgi:hypothetical protein
MGNSCQTSGRTDCGIPVPFRGHTRAREEFNAREPLVNTHAGSETSGRGLEKGAEMGSGKSLEGTMLKTWGYINKP